MPNSQMEEFLTTRYNRNYKKKPKHKNSLKSILDGDGSIIRNMAKKIADKLRKKKTKKDYKVSIGTAVDAKEKRKKKYDQMEEALKY